MDEQLKQEQQVEELPELENRVSTPEDDSQYIERLLGKVVKDTANLTGDEYFHSLVRSFAEAFNVRYALVTRSIGFPPTHARTLAFWTGDEFGEEVLYPTEDTPCDKVVKGDIYYVSDGVQELFPKDTMLVDMGVNSFLGVPIMNSSGAVVGHFAFLDPDSIVTEPGLQFVVQAFAGRTVAEIERMDVEQALSESERAFYLMTDALPICISYVDSNCCYRFVNATYEIWHNMPRREILGRHISEIIGKETFEAAKHHIDAALNGESRSFDMLARYERSESRYVHVKCIPRNDVHGEVTGFYALIEDITQRKEDEEKLQVYQQQLRAMASELFLAEQTERHRIADGLHDRTLQTLAAIQLTLGAMQSATKDTPQEALLEEARGLTEKVIQDTRSLVFELSPPVLYDLGLKTALEWLADRMKERVDTEYEVEDQRDSEELDKNLEVFLFKSVRELWRNASQHGKASRVRTVLTGEAGRISVEVHDNGVGFDDSSEAGPTEAGGFGLFSIRERIGYLGGSVKINSTPHDGAHICLCLPTETAGKPMRNSMLAQDAEDLTPKT